MQAEASPQKIWDLQIWMENPSNQRGGQHQQPFWSNGLWPHLTLPDGSFCLLGSLVNLTLHVSQCEINDKDLICPKQRWQIRSWQSPIMNLLTCSSCMWERHIYTLFPPCPVFTGGLSAGFFQMFRLYLLCGTGEIRVCRENPHKHGETKPNSTGEG